MTASPGGSEHLSRDVGGRLRYTPPVRSLRPWSTLVMLLIAVTTAIEMLTLADRMLGLDLGLLSRGTDNWEFGVDLAETIALAALWCLWQHAAATNLEKRSPPAQRCSPARGVWAWFIPFLNLVRPAFVILDLWRGSEALVPSAGPRRPGRSVGIVIIALWWTAYVAPFVALPFMFILRTPGMTLPALGALVQVGQPLVHATLACVIVHRITRMQDAWLPGDADADPDGNPV